MLVVLIGEGEMYKLILPRVASGSYVIKDKENANKRLLEVEAQDGKWQITSDNQAKILNPEYIKISDEKIDIDETGFSDLFLNKVILEEYTICEIAIGENDEIYTLCCLPVYEENWVCLEMKNIGEIMIGRNPANHISYDNEFVSNVHARIFWNNGRWMIGNYDQKYGTFVNGNQVYNKTQFLFNGDTVFIMGLKIILMKNNLYVNNPLGNMQYNEKFLTLSEPKEMEFEETQEKTEDDERYIELYSPKDYFYKAPRISTKLDAEEITIESPPAKKNDDHMPFILSMGSTLCMGVMSLTTIMSIVSNITNGNSTVSQNVTSILSASAMLMSMLLIPILTKRWEKSRDRNYEEKRQKRYREYINKKRNEIEKMKQEQRKILFSNYATTEECTTIILNKDDRLWERIIEDPDFLSINIGVGDVPFDIQIRYPEKAAFSMDDEEDNLVSMVNQFTQEIETLKNAPVIVSLTSEKIIAYIDRSEENIDRFMQHLFIQLMAFQSYTDLKLVFLLKKENLKKWEYMKLLPYVWNDEKDFRFIEDDVSQMEEISKYLSNEFAARQEKEGQESNAKESYKRFSPYYLIITDDYRKIENLKIVNNILNKDGNLGFSIFCITNDIRQLPNECKMFINISGNKGKIFNNEVSSKREINFKFNNLDIFFFENIIKTVANIPIKYKLTEKNSLPNHYTFLEMYNVGLIEQLNILERWKNNDSTLSLAAPIGVNSAGKLVSLDIHEKFHGPHGLIAGSTGSGKSEFIITYILSLALNYHPDDVTFILIDYKGGGLAGAFQKQEIKLPHLVGTITNIDKEGLQRSLVSIQSELRRRQVQFNEARELTDGGTIDIYKYQKLYHNGVVQKPIPHLLIICDEFAELKQQQPDFMNELVSVARIGRSLGVHLILATQKPSGVVDDQIRSNSKFAICLKVQDKSDSSDMIEKPDAAYIKQAGRFYIRVGNDEYFDLGQSGWAGAQYYPSDVSQKTKDDSIKFISNTGTVIKEINDYTKKTVTSQGDQLTNLVKQMYQIAKNENITAEKLWLDDIPEKIYVKDVKEKYHFNKKNNHIVLTVGEYDDPANQKQGIVKLDLIKGGNIIIYGSADSGKETLMSTIVYDLMTTYTTDEVWMYILDFGTETFKIFQGCPHVGEVIFAKDGEKLSRFFTKIKEIVKERKQILTDYNGDYNFFLKTSGQKMPLITILINGYETFTENYQDLFDDILLILTREGVKTGIVFIFSTMAANDLRYRMGQNFKQKMALSLNDSGDYGNIFDGIRGRKPARRFGRGFVNLGEEVYEFQTAKSCEPEEYNVFIKEEIERIKKKNKTTADKIPVLPDVVKVEELQVDWADIERFPVGLRKKDIGVELYDFKNNFVNIITAKNLEEAIQYGNNIWDVMRNIEKIDVITLDAERKVLSGKNELKQNFEKLLEKIGDDSKKHTVCFVFGLNKLNRYLEENASQNSSDDDDDDDDDEDNDTKNDVIEKIDDLVPKFENQENISFIVVDSSDKIKENNYDDWYRKNVMGDNIIWVGNGIQDQYLLDVDAPRKEIVNDCGCSFGFLNKKDKTFMLKLLEMKEKRDEDDE